MKTILLPRELKRFRANLHSHSTFSDGKLTTAEVKELYKAHGYAVVAFSDHEVFVPHPELDDPEFIALRSSEYSMSDGAPESQICAKPGEEWTWTRMPTFHLNIFAKNKDETEAPALEIKNAKEPFSYERVNALIAECNRKGFLVQYNHPYWSLNTQEDWRALKGLWSLEILNYATQHETGAEYCPMVYDDMLRFGNSPLLHCSMGDDNHNKGADRGLEEQCFGGSTFFCAPELTYEAIIHSMETGEFFCASGVHNPPQIHEIWIEDGMVKIDCSPATHVYRTTDARDFAQARGDGITHAEFKLDKTMRWFRLTVEDEQGNFANSNAYAVQPEWLA